MSSMGPNRADGVRAIAVLAAALLQFVVGAIGGSGLAGESVGDVARSYPNPLLPAGTAFMIWNLIYLSVLALAVWQLLPGQRGEAVHRRTGWWIVVAGVLNAAWVGLFSSGQIVASQIVIVVLLLVLAMVWRRAASVHYTGTWSRLLLWAPLSLYTGWVTVATAVGALTTVAAVSSESAGFTVAIGTLMLVGAVVLTVVARGVAVLAFAGAAVWALVWIAAQADTSVAAVAVVIALLVTVWLGVRLFRAPDRSRVAFG